MNIKSKIFIGENMKAILLTNLKNLLALLSFDFWKSFFKEPCFGIFLILLVIFGAISDILQMILIPEYSKNNKG